MITKNLEENGKKFCLCEKISIFAHGTENQEQKQQNI